jgi:hypothetical protein
MLFLSLALGTVVGCSKEEPSKAPTTEKKSDAERKPGGHAPAGVKPGSHEDWCGEHQVPESQCTRCNADLIPAFKATNDWCPEHGLPESQCKICNPGIDIKRPPKGS